MKENGEEEETGKKNEARQKIVTSQVMVSI